MNRQELINILTSVRAHLERLDDDHWKSDAPYIDNAIKVIEDHEEIDNINIMPTDANNSDFIAYDYPNDIYFRISEGTGDNLLQEDLDAGYIDYIYYSNYNTYEDAINETDGSDGGMVLLKTPYKDLSVDEILRLVDDVEGTELETVG